MYQHAKIPGIIFCVLIIAYSQIAYSDENAWEILKRGGHVVLMRHATAEQAGDPLAFTINDCSVQRNLSQKGRREAELVGRAFRAWSVPIAKVLSSRYCRTQETAKLAFGRVTTWQPLDLLYALPEQDRDARTEVVTERIGAYAGNGNLIMITHRPNIDALTFEIVEPGGLLVLEPDHEGSFNIVVHLSPDDLKVK
jgi:phosphohistidine phosphatase SixA